MWIDQDLSVCVCAYFKVRIERERERERERDCLKMTMWNFFRRQWIWKSERLKTTVILLQPATNAVPWFNGKKSINSNALPLSLVKAELQKSEHALKCAFVLKKLRHEWTQFLLSAFRWVVCTKKMNLYPNRRKQILGVERKIVRGSYSMSRL